jgi:hypothetical protein
MSGEGCAQRKRCYSCDMSKLSRRLINKRARQRVRMRRNWLVQLAGSAHCGVYLRLTTVQLVYETLYLVERGDMFDSFRVPRSLRALWQERREMVRNDDGYVISGDWESFAKDSQWIADSHHWHFVAMSR